MKRMMLGAVLLGWVVAAQAQRALALQSDFGVKDGAVSAMRGVAFGVKSAAADFRPQPREYAVRRLGGGLPAETNGGLWPAGTVFVSVVDPGVGTARKSMRAANAERALFRGTRQRHVHLGRGGTGDRSSAGEIDTKTKHRRQGSERSQHVSRPRCLRVCGRATGGGSGDVRRRGTGIAGRRWSRWPTKGAAGRSERRWSGRIPALDYQHGNVWTNLDDALFAGLTPKFGEPVSGHDRSGGQNGL